MNCFQVTERTQIYYRNHYDILDVERAMTPKVGSLINVYERKEGQFSVSAEMINSYPLYKASFLDSPESTDGAYCMIIEGSDPRGRGSYIWHSTDVRAE